MKPVIIITIAFVLLIPISVNAEVNPYEIIEVSLNKEFVEKGKMISVEGKVTRIHPDFKNVVLIIETKEGHRTDYTTTPVDDDGSFERSWQTGSIYSSTWGESGVFIIKMNYGPNLIWKEIEFVYCDKTHPKHPRYLEHCQEAYGYVEQLKPNLELEIETKPLTKSVDGMKMEQQCTMGDRVMGLPKSQCTWVETDDSYSYRIIIPLIFNIIIIIVVIVVIIVVIQKVKRRKKKPKPKFLCGHCGHIAKTEKDLYNHSQICEKYQKEESVSQSQKSPLEILKERYAKGEITKGEFENMKSDIED